MKNGKKNGKDRRLHLLVVDDDPALLDLMVQLLGQNHEVVGFSDPLQALEEIESGAPFDGVVSDLCMNELSGKELFERIQKINPDLAQRFVLITGGASDPGGQDFMRQMGRRVLLKPFTSQLLLKHVEHWMFQTPAA